MSVKYLNIWLALAGWFLCVFNIQAIEIYKLEESEYAVDNKVKIAFLADIHLHDVFAKVSDDNEMNLAVDVKTKQPVLIRSLYAQLNSTRLFNENYFSFIQALDELVLENVKLVALPGDFTDDGQPINIRALSHILRKYEKQHGMRFFAIPGNHDPVKPFTVESGKSDFLTSSGKEIGLYSAKHPKCLTHKELCFDGVKNWGYQEIFTTLNDFGFSKRTEDLLYEMPYKNRYINWCDPSNKQRCVKMPDASYLVEPVNGVWLLAIDANVYQPQWQHTPVTFKGSSNAGYNQLITAKPALIEWIKTVVKRAKQHNKTLVAFSHFPMMEFYNDSGEELKSIFAKNKFQLPRVPTKHTAKVLADTGLILHFAGHMHLNDVAHVKNSSGGNLVNVQVPSLAAYKPAYKTVTLDLANKTGLVTTHIVKLVAQFNRFFPQYRREWQHRHKHGLVNFNKNILNAKHFSEFTQLHLLGLVEQRFLKKDWPELLTDWLGKHDNLYDWFESMECISEADIHFINKLTTITNKQWLQDFYLLRSGDVIADVDEKQRGLYIAMNKYLAQSSCQKNTQIQQYLSTLISIMAKFSLRSQNQNMMVDLTNGKITNQ